VELGRQALVEKAKALTRLAEQMRAARPDAREWQGLVRQALQAARGVAERPGPYAGEAIRLITRLLGTVDVTQAAVSPAEAIAVAQSAMRGKRYEEAVAAYRQAIRLSPRPDAPTAVRAWFGIGRCHYYLKQYREAAIVFEHVGQSFPASADGPRAAYLAVQCWMTAQGQSRHEAERRAGMRSLAAALERYGTDPRIGELRVLRGQLLQREGRYEAALRTFQAVPAGAAGYARAQYEAGLCAYDWFINLFRRDLLGEDGGKAQYGAAVAHLKAYLALVKDARRSAPRSRPRGGEEERERIGTARLVLATIHNDLLGDAKSALGFLDFAFPAYLSVKVLPLRLKALIQQQRVEEALAVLKEVRATAKADPKRLQEALQQLGAALDQQAEALRKKGDRDAYLAAARRTAEFLLGVLKENPDQDAEMYLFVASRLIRIERFRDASDVLRQLIARFAADPTNKAVVLSARLSLVECSMGTDAWREAIEQLHALQKTYPDSARLKALLATCYVESGQRDKGIPVLQDLFRNVYRGGTRPWYEVGLALARAHEKAGRKDRALAVTSHVRLLYAPFWNGRDTENLDLAEQYKELHKRCGGT